MIESKVVDLYSNEIKKYGIQDRRALFWTKDKQDIRFNILLGEELKCSKMTLLDYGCGTSDLKDFLTRSQYSFVCNGCDINNEFIQESLKKYPKDNVFHINSVDDVTDHYDVVLVSGTFNLTGIADYTSMEKYVFSNIQKLFSKTDYMLTINFLSHLTDPKYQYKEHFYLDPMKLYEFACKNMTTRIKIDTSSLPFEITMKFYKNTSFDPKTVLFDDI